MLITNVTTWTCDNCGKAGRVCRIQVAAEDGERLPFLMVWICAECLRRLAAFTDRTPSPPG